MFAVVVSASCVQDAHSTRFGQAAALAPVLVDPVDCFVAATALTHGATLMTADARLLKSRVVRVLNARR